MLIKETEMYLLNMLIIITHKCILNITEYIHAPIPKHSC
jgi:hypothetical protein